ncbi:hypothetical protein [Noviherbaspirillum saxi]|uniref:Tir chaperone protein (CesT) family protein n=1 Tax=Noviherbaspirillum saxi TaxID=2320863 RepID=A0A3A3FGM5_9BURK|nr:hypothetical protein [Noviherbaspirillum saxi]RJF92330.1 hypothetical protein D3871_27280 [Noviherbaspirillum saxi]
MKKEPGAQPQAHTQQDKHLQRLRDLLDLPLNTLQHDVLFFTMADKYPVIVRRVDTRYLSLVCEIARLDALTAANWEALLTRLSAAYDYAFPVSPLTTDGKLALLWRCDADVPVDQWLRWAEDALTFAFDLQARLNANAL